ncbi:MAG: tRNA pseudouridine(38-40) synthase TruA [Pseudomonadales bacterium]|nr:tRNA pseudouridine(38-40) synthase TruA [Pseudomonadales bacterium]
MKQRFALGIEYDGAAFHGWQKQSAPRQHTVQDVLQQALSRVADHEVTVVCAGRTDAGVHATAQVVHFDTDSQRPVKAWIRGGNSLLPAAVRIIWAELVEPTFHARFSALSRRYRYLIREAQVAPALLARQVTWVSQSLDVQRMDTAVQFLLGENDFSAFRAAGCQSKTPFRCVMAASVKRQGEFVVLDIQANAFLQHMVRNITGALLEVGAGRQQPEWIRSLLQTKDRRLGAMTAKPYGLYLVAVEYPQEYQLPSMKTGPIICPA